MRQFLILALGILASLSIASTAEASFCFVANGCTGTSTAPGYGGLLIGGANGEYEFVASSTLPSFAPVQSVFSRTGAITAQSGDYTTDQVTEGSNLYYTSARGLADFITNLAATSSVKSIVALPSLLLPYSQLTGTPTIPANTSDLMNDSGFIAGYDAYTHPAYGGSATSSLMTLTGGILSTASSTFTSSLHLGTTNAVLATDGNGLVTATTSIGVNYLTGIIPAANGGLGANFSSAASGVMVWSNALGHPVISSPLAISNGGTGQSSFAAGLLYSDGSALSPVSTSTWTFASSTLLADTNTFSAATTTFTGGATFGTSTPRWGKAGDLITGLNHDLLFSSDLDTNTFLGNIQFRNMASTSKSGLEWYDYLGNSVAWIVAHYTNPGADPTSHTHIEIETSDASGQKQGRLSIGYGADAVNTTINQSDLVINYNTAGAGEGNLKLKGGNIQSTGSVRLLPTNGTNSTNYYDFAYSGGLTTFSAQGTNLLHIGSATIFDSNATTTGNLGIAGGSKLDIVAGNASSNELIERIMNSSNVLRMSWGYDATNVGLKLNNRSGTMLYDFRENGFMGIGLDPQNTALEVLGTASTTNLHVNGVAASSLLRLDSSRNLSAVTIGSGLSFNGTTLSATGGGAGLSTSTPLSAGNLLAYSNSGAGYAYGIATTTTGTASSIVALSSTQKTTIPYASTTVVSSSGSAYFATAGGNVGIGSTNPSALLSIGSGNLTTIDSSGNISTTGTIQATGAGNNYFSDSSAYFIVGSTSPELVTSAGKPNIQVQGTTGAQLGAFVYSSTAGQNAQVALGHSCGTTLGSYDACSSGTSIGALNFTATDGSAFIKSAFIKAFVDGTVSTGIVPGRIEMQTFDSGGTARSRFVTDSLGNIYTGKTTNTFNSFGINDQNFTNILSLSASTSDATYGNQLALRSHSEAITSGELIGGISFWSDDTNLTGAGQRVAYIQGLANETHTATALGTDLIFSATASGATTPAERMRLTGGGNVGIGTTSPGTLLSIGGNGTGINFVDGISATSTIQGNLRVVGTLRATNSYVGDLVFANGVRLTERGDQVYIINPDGTEAPLGQGEYKAPGAPDNHRWLWIAIALLALGLLWQQRQIYKLKKRP